MSSSLANQIIGEIPALKRYARYLTRGEAAEDLVQETLLKALQKTELFTPGTSIAAWLHTIMRHLHINELRRSRMTYVDHDVLDALMPASQPNQENGLFMRDLTRAMASISSERRSILLLVAIDGMTSDEVAATLNINKNTVKSRLGRGRDEVSRIMNGSEQRAA